MSVIFGVVREPDCVVEDHDLLKLSACTQRYAAEGTAVYAKNNVGMGFQPYRTHQRSYIERLPVVDSRGNILSLDGRLDNHEALAKVLGMSPFNCLDSQIILEAFSRWGEECFSQFIGEWSLALWSQDDRALYLARDHAGTRTLYFEHTKCHILWSTYLETFFDEGRRIEIDEEFAALYLSCQPIRQKTPYKGLKAVPPAHYIRFKNGSSVCKSHWEWMAKGSITYNEDVKYEEHFLHLFRQSIERRTGSGAPIIAQLSGGMDSTSIVCMSDFIRRSHSPEIELLDTISYFDNSEPNWDEMPFFSAVESSRGKIGVHLDISYRNRTIRPQCLAESSPLWPGADSSGVDLDIRLHQALKEHGCRSILSGIGGDETLGGVPTPAPELADLMVRGKLCPLLGRSVEWCMVARTPLLYMLSKTLLYTVGLYRNGRSARGTTPPWLNGRIHGGCRDDLAPMSIWDRLRCPVPSRIANGEAWWTIMETMPTRLLSSEERYEYRYPYLDRDLVDYLFRIPRYQLVRPGRRRSLMRRALKDIVPDVVLERRRKAFLIRGPINLIRQEREWLSEEFRRLHSVELGLVIPSVLQEGLDAIATQGDPKWLACLMRLISFEFWLRVAPIKESPNRLEWVGEKDPGRAVFRTV